MNRAELIEALMDRLLQLSVEQIALRGLLRIYEKNPDTAYDNEHVQRLVEGNSAVDAIMAEHGFKAGRYADEAVTSAQKEFVDKIVENRRPKYDWDAVKEMYDTDATIREIAEKFDMPKSTIQTHAHRHGWKKRYKKWEPQQKPAPGKRGVKKGEAFWDCVRSDWENSTDSVRKISRDMAVAESAIHYHAKKEEWGPRPKKAERKPLAPAPIECPSCGLLTDAHLEACSHCHTVLPTSVRI